MYQFIICDFLLQFDRSAKGIILLLIMKYKYFASLAKHLCWSSSQFDYLFLGVAPCFHVQQKEMQAWGRLIFLVHLQKLPLPIF